MRKLRLFVILSLSRQVYERKQRTLSDTAEFRVLKGFVQNGHEVHALMPKEKGIREEYSYHGIAIHEFKNVRIPRTNGLVSKSLLTLAQRIEELLFVLFSLKRFSEIVKSCGKPDLVYGYMPLASITTYLISRLYGIPSITRLFGAFLYTSLSSPRDLFLRMGYLELLSFKLPCQYLIITNDGTRGDEAAKRLGVPHERVKYFMDGADFLEPIEVDTTALREKLGIPGEVHLLLSVCRLTNWKRVDRIIEAIPEIARVNKNIKVLIIGEGEERRNLEFLCDKLDVRDFVVFLGAVTHNRIRDFMLIADVFVSLYDFTNLSNSSFEAMACGLCVVALNTGATSQVIKNGVNGVLIDPPDLKKLPDIINWLLTDDDSRNKLSRKARQYALENFESWEERVSKEVNLIESSFNQARQDYSTGQTADPRRILEETGHMIEIKREWKNPFRDGRATARIVKTIKRAKF